MYTTILWDMDATLLDFKAAEKAAICALFQEFDLGPCTDDMIARYSLINHGYWKKLELGQIAKADLLVRRFRDFFESEGLCTDVAADFNAAYQVRLGDTVVFCNESDKLVASLKGRVKQYVVSNGTVIAQTKKLKNSGFDKLMDGVFLSEEVGAEKPSPFFFDAVFRAIGPIDKREVLIVGDSLTSDIRGGNNAGIATCWYNPSAQPNTEGVQVDYEIRDLHEIVDLL